MNGCPLPEAAHVTATTAGPNRPTGDSSSADRTDSAISPLITGSCGTRLARHLYNPTQREISIDKINGKDLLSPNREFDLRNCASAVPEGCTIQRLVVIDVLPLTSLRFPLGESCLAQLQELSIVNSSLESTDDLFECLAEIMPRLERLDLSGSRLTHIKGVQRLVSNGLKTLNLKGARINDIDGLTEIARHVRAGTWTGRMLLEELDVRDNVISK